MGAAGVGQAGTTGSGGSVGERWWTRRRDWRARRSHGLGGPRRLGNGRQRERRSRHRRVERWLRRRRRRDDVRRLRQDAHAQNSPSATTFTYNTITSGRHEPAVHPSLARQLRQEPSVPADHRPPRRHRQRARRRADARVLRALRSSQGSTIFIAPDAAGGLWSATSDTTFVSDILKQVEADLCIDLTRVELEGFSQGAAMSSTLACSLPGTFRAAIGHSAAAWPIRPRASQSRTWVRSASRKGTGRTRKPTSSRGSTGARSRRCREHPPGDTCARITSAARPGNRSAGAHTTAAIPRRRRTLGRAHRGCPRKCGPSWASSESSAPPASRSDIEDGGTMAQSLRCVFWHRACARVPLLAALLGGGCAPSAEPLVVAPECPQKPFRGAEVYASEPADRLLSDFEERDDRAGRRGGSQWLLDSRSGPDLGECDDRTVDGLRGARSVGRQPRGEHAHQLGKQLDREFPGSRIDRADAVRCQPVRRRLVLGCVRRGEWSQLWCSVSASSRWTPRLRRAAHIAATTT